MASEILIVAPDPARYTDLCARVNEVPSVVDALTAAVASAVAKVSGNALAELKILGRATALPRSTPYRGRY